MNRPAIILAALLCMASRHPDRMIRSDLALNASFNRGDATDRSMYAATPTLAGNAVVTAGQRYLTLDGAGDYVTYPDRAEYTFNSAGQDLPFSATCWIYLSATPSGNLAVASKLSTYSTCEWVLRCSSGGASAYPQFLVLNNAASAYRGRRNPSALSTGQWYFFAGTYSGNEATTGIKIYVNGSQTDTVDVTSGAYTGMSDSSSTMTIGSAGGGEYFNGNIDDVRIYSRELSAAEVAALYSEGRP